MTRDELRDLPVGSLIYQQVNPDDYILSLKVEPDRFQEIEKNWTTQSLFLFSVSDCGLQYVTDYWTPDMGSCARSTTDLGVEPECRCNRDDFTHSPECPYLIWNKKRFGRL